MRVSLKAIKGVGKIEVSLNKGLATVEFEPSNAVTTKQLLDAIAKNGFVTKQSRVVAAGDVIATGTAVRLKISGSNEILTLSGDDKQLRSFVGKHAVIEGIVREVSKGKVAEEIKVTTINEARP